MAIVFWRISPPLLDHIPLYSPLYAGVQREGLVTWSLSLSISPPSPTHLELLDHGDGVLEDGVLVELRVRPARQQRPQLVKILFRIWIWVWDWMFDIYIHTYI